MGVDYNIAREELLSLFNQAELIYQGSDQLKIDASIIQSSDVLFNSNTQSFREVLLGCCLIRLLDENILIRQPYMNQGHGSFNGRSLDEKVINPFFQDHSIPCSKGPYLASFRRSVKFIPETANGLRDKAAYNALLHYLNVIENANREEVVELTIYLLYRFIQLRDRKSIIVTKISRLSLEQYRALIDMLLRIPSGGQMPVLLVVATIFAIKECYSLNWEIKWKGVNVSDRASGMTGDITVFNSGAIILSIEVTERVIDRARTVSTFNTKILENGIEDYLFLHTQNNPTSEAYEAAAIFFSQGHEINFTNVNVWICNNLLTMGSMCRLNFLHRLIALLESSDVSASVRIAWNQSVKSQFVQ